MEKWHAQRLFDIYEDALAVLGQAESIFQEIQDESERKTLLRSHAQLTMSLLTDFRFPLLREYPEFDTSKLGEEDDHALTLEVQEVINQLTFSQLAEIDRALLSNCVKDWRKVARVVGTTMMELGSDFRGIPDIYFAQRIAILVEEGHLELAGNLAYMRFSEVRRPA